MCASVGCSWEWLGNMYISFMVFRRRAVLRNCWKVRAELCLLVRRAVSEVISFLGPSGEFKKAQKRRPSM